MLMHCETNDSLFLMHPLVTYFVPHVLILEEFRQLPNWALTGSPTMINYAQAWICSLGQQRGLSMIIYPIAFGVPLAIWPVA